MDGYKIWYQTFDKNGNKLGSGFYTKEYKRIGYAFRMAEKLFDDYKDRNIKFVYDVSKDNPWIKKCEICGREFNTEVNHYRNVFSRYAGISYVGVGVSNHETGCCKLFHLSNICSDCAKKIRSTIVEMMVSKPEEK